MTSTALILGITGQTGAYLAKRLHTAGYHVVGTSRSSSEEATWRLRALGIRDSIDLATAEPMDPRALAQTIHRCQPDEIYSLLGPSSVAGSFSNPTDFFSHITGPIAHLLEYLKNEDYRGSFFNACSTDCFGEQPANLLTEQSTMRPVSPYGIAKAATFHLTKTYREGFGLRASSGILTNHDSPLRGEGFVTQKVITTLQAIAHGNGSTLTLGNTSVARDWVWAEEVAAAVHLMGSAKDPDDYVVASGTTRSLNDFVAIACAVLGLDMEAVVETDASLHRPLDISSVRLDPAKINETLGWSATKTLEQIVGALIDQPNG